MTAPAPRPIATNPVQPSAAARDERDGREIRRGTAGELRAVRADGKVVLTGYASVYDVRSEPIYGMFYEIVRRGAFAAALKGDDDVRALFDHDSGRVLGRTRSRTLRLSDDAKGLKFELDLPDTTDARDLATLIERRDISEMSFGFRKLKDRWQEETQPDGLVVTTRELLEVELFDVSPVAYPAYPETDVSVRSFQGFRAERAAAGMEQRRRRLRLAEAS